MKVLQINCTYSYGSTGKIVKDIHYGLLSNGFESIVCYGIGNKIKENNIYKFSNIILQKLNAFLSRINGLMYGGCYFQTKKIITIIKKEKPDIVHIHCINGHIVNVYKLIKWLKDNKIKTVITNHAEFYYTANCGYSLDCNNWKTGCGNCPRLRKETKSIFIDNTHLSWKKMYYSFKKFSNIKITSVSPWLINRAKISPILCNFDHHLILNGVDTDIFKSYNQIELKQKYGFNDTKIIFHATPFFCDDKDHIKGGYYLIELAKMFKNDNVHFFVAGSYDKNIIVPDNITLLGNISDQVELAKFYSMADLFILVSKKETFSMTTAEALCCGTPVVGFKAGAPEQIAIDDFSSFVEYGNLNELYNETIKYLNNKKSSEISNLANKKYSKDKMISEYIDLYKSF